ncbi:unnamed protein product [Ilex paraguariensis]|uniref:Uncharacterized protein n=1 Tax=Ilex paraguariensis TaxID=185542 RepID=A0ABC8UTT3_9AQUA
MEESNGGGTTVGKESIKNVDGMLSNQRHISVSITTTQGDNGATTSTERKIDVVLKQNGWEVGENFANRRPKIWFLLRQATRETRGPTRKEKGKWAKVSWSPSRPENWEIRDVQVGDKRRGIVQLIEGESVASKRACISDGISTNQRSMAKADV